MNPFIFFLCVVICPLMIYGQTVVSGKVADQKGRPVGGVSISIKDAYDGGTSDSLGNFSFRTQEHGEQTIQATSIGYIKVEQKVVLTANPARVSFFLKEEPTELKAVVITAGTFEASDSKRTTVLNSIDIVTTASANADVTSAIRTLPGAQQVGEKEGLFVRGGTAGETKIFIDGTRVNNFFLSGAPDIASRGRFSPFLFKGTIFSSGGYSAQYGQALSSVLILESIDMPERSSASLSLSTVGLSAGYQQLSANKKASWGGSYSFTNLMPYFQVVKQTPDYFKVPAFHNLDFNYRLKTSETGILKIYGYFNVSQLGLRRPDIDSLLMKNAFDVHNINAYGNLSWKESLGDKWKMNVGISWSDNCDHILNELQNHVNEKQVFREPPFNQKNFRIKNTSQLTVARAVFERRLKGLTALRFGGEFFHASDRSGFNNDSLENLVSVVKDRLAVAFAETDIYITNDLAAKIGVRGEQSSLLRRSNVAPRISLAYKLGGAGQASFAYGTFYQTPEYSYILRGYRYNVLTYTKSEHYIINYQMLSREYTLRVEGFYKRYSNLVKTTYSPGFNDSLSNRGYGYAKGLELFWRDRKTLKNVDYWISYSFLDTRRDHLNYPMALQPDFAAAHTASLVIKKFVMPLKTQFNVSYSFASGRPYYNIRYNQSSKTYGVADMGKTISYNNLSFSLNYLPNVGQTNAKKFAVFVFSITNVLGSKHVYGYRYSYNGMRKEPITPPAGRFYFLGCFLSFGVDKTEDVINNNL